MLPKRQHDQVLGASRQAQRVCVRACMCACTPVPMVCVCVSLPPGPDSPLSVLARDLISPSSRADYIIVLYCIVYERAHLCVCVYVCVYVCMYEILTE